MNARRHPLWPDRPAQYEGSDQSVRLTEEDEQALDTVATVVAAEIARRRAQAAKPSAVEAPQPQPEPMPSGAR